MRKQHLPSDGEILRAIGSNPLGGWRLAQALGLNLERPHLVALWYILRKLEKAGKIKRDESRLHCRPIFWLVCH